MARHWKMVEAKWTIEDVGAYLLNSLADGLYAPKEVLREYVQNAVDACVEYEKTVGRRPSHSIQVRIDPDNASVAIFDRGIGMDEPQIKRAKSIAVCPKLADNDDYVGFRGIGIWSGLAACETLILVSTRVDVPFAYKLTIDCKSIVQNYDKGINIAELMEGRFRIERDAAQATEHYTYVKLANVYGRYQELLDINAMTEYASQNLPVQIDPDWKYRSNVRQILSEVPSTTEYKLTINGQPVYRHFPDQTDEPEQEVIKDCNGREVAVAWFARTNKTAALRPKRESYEVTNYAVRIKNFVVGDRRLYASDPPSLTDMNLLDWFVGEIFVTDPEVKPDTNRQRFNPSPRSEAAIDAIREFYTRSTARARAWSAEVNALKACDEAVKAAEELEELIDCKARPEELAVPRKNLTELGDELNRYQNQVKVRDTPHDTLTARKNGKVSRKLQESLATQEIRKALRKPNVKAALNQAVGRISSIQERLDALTPQEPSDLVITPSRDNTAKRGRTARTANSNGDPVSVRDALDLKAVTGSSTIGEGAPASDLVKGRQIDLDKALSAFKAAAATVLGENSEEYRQVMQHLSEELRRRGIADGI